MFEKIFDEIKNNLKNPKLYIFLLVVALIILILFPYIDANFLYYKRVSNRIDILTQISEVDFEKIESNEILASEYENILLEIDKQSDGSLGSVFIKDTDSTVENMKFITGGILFWFLAIACLFMNTFKDLGTKIAALVMVTVFGIIFGFIAQALPTIADPMVNYVGFPMVIIIAICLLATMGNKKQQGEHK